MISPKNTKTKPTSSSSSNQAPSSSAETISGNLDILTEILSRLPLKSLLKFKSVSKQWLSLITDPKFRPVQSSKTLSGLFLRRPLGLKNTAYDFINLGPNPCKPPFKILDFVHDPSGIRILQSCNGLLLCCSFRPNLIDKNYYIYNPTTKQSTVLPVLTPGTSVKGVTLAFDPSKSPDYKVICVRNPDSNLQFHYQIQIYSPKTGPWRPSGRPFAAPTNIDFKNSVFCNGSVHWISDFGDSLRFDVNEEQIREQPMPVLPRDSVDERLYKYVGESGGYLHLIEIYASFSLPFDVYQMERDCSRWFPKYRVDLSPVAAAFPHRVTGYVDPFDLIYYEFVILGVIQGESDEDSYLVMQLPNKTIRYNFWGQRVQKIRDFAPLDDGTKYESLQEPGWFDAYQFVESFAGV